MRRWKNAFQTGDEIYRLKRSAVLREAARIIGQRGFHNTSLDDIAETLQVAKGTLYNYIKDKQEILHETHIMGLDLGDEAAIFADQVGKTGLEKLRVMIRCYAVWMYGEMGVGGVTSDIDALRPSDRESIVSRRNAIDNKLISYIEEGIADGSVHADNPKIAVYTIMSAINGIPTWFSSSGPMSIEHVVDIMLNVLTGALATSPAPAEPGLPPEKWSSLK